MKKDYPLLAQGNAGGRFQGNGKNQNQQGNGGRGQGQQYQQQRQIVQPAQGTVRAAYYAEPIAYQHQQIVILAVAPQTVPKARCLRQFRELRIRVL